MSSAVLEVRALGVDDWQLWRGLRLRALAEAPYAFGSTLAQWQGAGDREERWRERLAQVPLNLVAVLSGEPLGMLSLTATDEHGSAEIISLWVEPMARGLGLGDALVTAAVEAARSAHARRVLLSVTESNAAANALYRRNRFEDVLIDGRPVVEQGERRMQRRLDTPPD